MRLSAKVTSPVWLVALAMLVMAGGCTAETRSNASDRETDRSRILGRMAAQELAWNAGDIEGFMRAYWPSDSLLFVGSKGPSRGWATTLANYRKSYPDRKAMGTLLFEVEDLTFAGEDHALMLGSWQLNRTGGLDTLSGWFSLVWERKEGDWVIVRDHSS